LTSALASLLSPSEIRKRLLEIFPEGTPNRNYCTRDIAARTVFVMLYVGAIAGRDRFIRPDQVTQMTNRQAARQSDASRAAWARDSLRKAKSAIPGRWYAANTREPIRDETLREGLLRVGAAVERAGLPTTSARPRYALQPGFAALFGPSLRDDALGSAIASWREQHLSAGALARIRLLQRGAVTGREGVFVTFPNGETRALAAGPSSVISKAVIEDFAPRFLSRPGVIFLSESGNRVVARDEQLARDIGLAILPNKLLPDIVLVDLGPAEPLLVFIEVVATDGAVTPFRRDSLLELATKAGFTPAQIAVVSAFIDRGRSAFRRSIDQIAWASFVWFAAEPDCIVQLHDGWAARGKRLADLLM
jgi:hypothetical protein